MDRDAAAARIQAQARGSNTRKSQKVYPSIHDERPPKGFNLDLCANFSPGFSYCQDLNVPFKVFEAGVLKNGVNKVGGYKRTALMWAIYNKLEEHYTFLLDKCDLTMQDEFGYTALHVALTNNNNNDIKMNKAAKCLVEAAGASLDLPCNMGVTPLHTAINVRNFAVSKLLIDNGFNINAIERNGNIGGWNTPLHYATMFNQVSICCLLIDAGANRNIKNEEKFTPLQLAEHYKKSSESSFVQVEPVILELLKTYQPNMDPNPYADYFSVDMMKSRFEEIVYEEVDFSMIGGTPEFIAREERENAERTREREKQLKDFVDLQIAAEEAARTTTVSEESRCVEPSFTSSAIIQDENSAIHSRFLDNDNNAAAAAKIQARVRGAHVRGVQVQQHNEQQQQQQLCGEGEQSSEQSDEQSGLVASPPKNPKPSFNRPNNSAIKEA